MKGPERPCSIKPQQTSSRNVLRRPVEPAAESGRSQNERLWKDRSWREAESPAKAPTSMKCSKRRPDWDPRGAGGARLSVSASSDGWTVDQPWSFHFVVITFHKYHRRARPSYFRFIGRDAPSNLWKVSTSLMTVSPVNRKFSSDRSAAS